MFSLANPWIILGAVVLVGGAITGAYVKGRGDGRTIEAAEHMTQDQIVQAAVDAANTVAAKAIAGIEVKNVYQRQTLEREIVRVPDYSACKHSPDGLRALNGALTNSEPVAAGAGELPAADATQR